MTFCPLLKCLSCLYAFFACSSSSQTKCDLLAPSEGHHISSTPNSFSCLHFYGYDITQPTNPKPKCLISCIISNLIQNYSRLTMRTSTHLYTPKTRICMNTHACMLVCAHTNSHTFARTRAHNYILEPS